MNILITGASGFLGSKISNELLCTNNKIYLFCNLNKLNNLSKKFIKKINWKNNNNFKELFLDIDLVIHCMSPDHKKEKNAFNNFIKINKIFLRELSKSKVKKLIYLSSVQVYGNNIKDEINENKKLIPDNNYSKSKITSEGLIKKYIKNYIILRISNSFGYDQSDKKVWSLFINNIILNYFKYKKIIIKSNPFIRKDFIASSTISDVIRQILLNNNKINKGIFNLSMNKSWSLLEISSYIKKILDKRLKSNITINYGECIATNNFNISNKKIIKKNIMIKNNINKRN